MIPKKNRFERVVAICQLNFLPWLGYFEMIDRADVFVALDDVQYVDREWVNRNRIRRVGKAGWQWVSASVMRGPRERKIREVLLYHEARWRLKMVKSIEISYRKTPFFKEYFNDIENILTEESQSLVVLNLRFVQYVVNKLDIADNIILSSTLGIEGHRDERLSKICRLLGADLYLANNGSSNYIDSMNFTKKGIGFVFQNYKHPIYYQGGQEFLANLSIIDLLFWHGPKSREILLAGRPADWMSQVQWG